ncbi:MAG: hypothetical protein GY747_01705 [Planctomycetes bacterium]|nr:hypothetical protein [Planctomycetota bacterium]MCP4769943.1 hypothetical protein [Planctomycetota bacterium]MCP4859783.1 hypothetical protein [Planctomycetota bacterium]
MRTFLISMFLCVAGVGTAQAQDPFGDETGPDPFADGVDNAFVIINDQVLTESQVGVIAARTLLANPTLDEQDAWAYALNQGIRRILYQESFERLGLDDSLLDPQVAARIEALILEDGSRQRFLQRIGQDGYTSIEDFRIALRHTFIEQTVAGMVSGEIPTPQQGKRKLSEPTPAEIREAYHNNVGYRESPGQFVWASLKFLKDPSLASHTQRAADTLRMVNSGQMTVQSALAKADRVSESDQIRPGIAKDLAEFLNTASVGSCMELPSSNPNLVQLILIKERTEARTYTFEEAQLFIAEDLKRIASKMAVREELSAVWQSAYVWITPMIPGLEDSLNEVFGGGKPSQKSYEL